MIGSSKGGEGGGVVIGMGRDLEKDVGRMHEGSSVG